jgi:hypothetical protein
VELRRDLDNQMRGLCKGLGILLGKAGSSSLASKLNAVLVDAPELRELFGPLLLAQTCLTEQVEKFSRQLLAMAKADRTVRRLMTVPGVGPLTALSFVATVDEAIRFTKQSYDLEDIRVLTYERLRNLVAMVNAVAYFTWKYHGLTCHGSGASPPLLHHFLGHDQVFQRRSPCWRHSPAQYAACMRVKYAPTQCSANYIYILIRLRQPRP